MGKSKSGSALPPSSSSGTAQPSGQTVEIPDPAAMPMDVVQSVFTAQDREKVSAAHGIPLDDILVPEAGDRPHLPPAGFMAWTKTHCECGAIPPLATQFRNMLIKFGLAPFQLSPNSYTVIAGMEIMKRKVKDSSMTPLELSYFYKLKRGKDGSFFNLEANHNAPCVKHLKSKAGNWRDSWFFVRNPHNLPASFRIPGKDFRRISIRLTIASWFYSNTSRGYL